MLAILLIAALIRHLGLFAAWWTNLQILVLLGYGPGIGYLTAMLLVDERDSGVDRALQVVPLPITAILGLRLSLAYGFVVSYAVLLVLATRMIELPVLLWMAPILSLSLGSIWTTVTVPALARDKVQALGLFKGLNLYVQIAALYLFLPRDAWYSDLLLVTPATWAVRSILALADGDVLAGYLWAAGGALLWLVLIRVSLGGFLRRQARDP